MTRCLPERRRARARQATTNVPRRLQAVVVSILTDEKVGALAETEATPPSEVGYGVDSSRKRTHPEATVRLGRRGRRRWRTCGAGGRRRAPRSAGAPPSSRSTARYRSPYSAYRLEGFMIACDRY